VSIVNIKDGRTRRDRWKRVNAIVEAAEHDNFASDADEAPDDGAPTYEEIADISVQGAIAWAQQMPGSVTLFLYDLRDGFSDNMVEDAH